MELSIDYQGIDTNSNINITQVIGINAFNEWFANPLGLRQTSALQIKTKSA